MGRMTALFLCAHGKQTKRNDGPSPSCRIILAIQLKLSQKVYVPRDRDDKCDDD
jgi:hypothetical protein